MEYNHAFGRLRSTRSKEKNDPIITLLCCLCLLFLGYLLYQSTTLLGLFDDDKGLIVSLLRRNWKEFLFNDYEIRFRPVFNLAVFLMWRICGSSTVTFTYMLPFLNCLLGILLFLVSDYIFRNRLLSFTISTIYLASRHAYYQTMMLYGIMEGLALFFAIATLLFLLNHILNNSRKSFVVSIICYILAVFTHERYLVLIAPILAAIWFALYPTEKKSRLKSKLVNSGAALGACGICVLIRVLVLKQYAWAGTGGSNMADTFSPEMIFKHIREQVLYLLGWGAPSTYLSGYSAAAMTGDVTAATIIFDVTLGLLLILFIISLIKNKGNERERKVVLYGFLTIVVFIGACIISSSTTIRVEMRWVYVSHAALLLGIAILTAYTIHVSETWLRITAIILSVITLSSSLYVESAYRQGWKNLHYYNDVVDGNSLMQIVMKYPDIQDRDVILIDPQNIVAPEHFEGFLYLMDARHKFIPRSISHYLSIYQYQNYFKHDDILLEYINGQYRDISGLIENSAYTFRTLSGDYHGDGWCSQEAEFEITPFMTDKFQLVFYTGANISGYSEEERKVYITLNGQDYDEFVFNGQYMLDNVILKRNEPNIITIKTSFVSPNVERNGTKLSYTVFFNQVLSN